MKFWIIAATCLTFPFFCCSAGIYYLEFFDSFTCGITISLVTLIEIYTFVYLFPLDVLETEVEKHTGIKAPRFIKTIL